MTISSHEVASNVSPEFDAETDRPELVFGLIGPIGTDLDAVCKAIAQSISIAGYSTTVIRVSEQIENIFGESLKNSPEDKRINALMDLGNSLRSKSKNAAAAAILSIFKIWEIRNSTPYEQLADGSKKGRAYILRSLKNPEEISKLRLVYGKGFIAVSVSESQEERQFSIAQRIAKSYLGRKPENTPEALAKILIDRDENEEDSLHQNVRDCFPLGDFFVSSSNKEQMRKQIRRFLHLTFGNRFHTPSIDEHGIFQASSAALRSADLNRQVGAAIVRSTGEIIAVGCNDVPKANGDQYWENDYNDARDFTLGFDSSARQREEMLSEFLGKLKQGNILSSKIDEPQIDALTKSLLYGDGKKILKGAGLLNLLEFGRSVHAEMAAITTAARLGLPVQGATLYSTTFPCHMCARHIVASGIKEVVYIEPYPKSKAKQLHKDSIDTDGNKERNGRYVTFRPFQGVAPRQYLTIFMSNDLRKDAEGRAIEFAMTQGKLRWQRFANTYMQIENDIIMRVLPDIVKSVRSTDDVKEKYNARKNVRTKNSTSKRALGATRSRKKE